MSARRRPDMSEGNEMEPDEPAQSVEQGGITVKKWLRREDETVTVTLEVTSTRAEPTTVRLSDPALASVAADRLEIHEDAVADLDPGSGQFERELDPGTTREITYRLVDADLDVDDIEAAPKMVTPDGEDVDELLDRARSDALRSFVGGERDSLSAADAPEQSSESTSEPGTSAESDSGIESTADGVARALLAELREDDLGPETRAALRSELRPERSRDVKLEHLQRRVSDLAAYTDTLERFIDEYGPLDEAFDGVESELEAIRAEQAELESRIETLEAEHDRIDDRLEELEAFRDGVSSVFRDAGDE
jgi:chromosome segregation ATPase